MSMRQVGLVAQESRDVEIVEAYLECLSLGRQT
jgi:hypothetical protein